MDLNELVLRVGARLPRALGVRALRWGLGRWSLALCLHRVEEAPRPGRRHPSMTIPPDRLDALLAATSAAVTGATPRAPRLTVSFDDGYADAVAYVETRAPRFPQLEWILFVCPQKAREQVGFQWDVEERTGAVRATDPRERWAGENADTELRAVARQEAFRIASVEELRRVRRRPNVALGNHTNTHLPLAQLRLEQAEEELQRSSRDFEEAFGPMRQFAFPFGTPRVSFGPEHVARLRAQSGATLWSTEARPYAPAEREANAVLPRFAIDGTRSVEATVLWLAYRCALARVRAAVRRVSAAGVRGSPGPGPTATGPSAARS